MTVTESRMESGKLKDVIMLWAKDKTNDKKKQDAMYMHIRALARMAAGQQTRMYQSVRESERVIDAARDLMHALDEIHACYAPAGTKEA